jgi:hypothetical protein
MFPVWTAAKHSGWTNLCEALVDMTKEQLEHALINEHGKLHALLFPNTVRPAEIKVRIITEEEIDARIPNLVSAYRDGDNTITIAVTEGDLEDDYRMNGNPLLGQEPMWKRELLHEAMHEFQYQCVPEPTNEGRELRQKSRRVFSGAGHDDRFYTAIAACAKKMGLPPEMLEARI